MIIWIEKSINILEVTADQFRSILDYEANHKIYEEFENKVRDY